MTTSTLYAEIVKAERNDEGDLVVVGKATGPDIDLDQQMCDPDWLGKAMPEWFSTGANIREQHSAIAAGVATELAQDGDSWMVTSTVVDPVTARKVEKGVLKGYSIGVRGPKVIKDKSAPGGRVIGGQIVEVSLVDRPCNPTCTLTLAKAVKPGMKVDPADLDKDRMLVKVEELIEKPVEQWADLPSESTPIPAGDMLKLDGANSTSSASPMGTYTITAPGFTFTTGTNANNLTIEPALHKGAMAPLKPGGPPRYPINSVADLKDAIQAIGRGKDSDKAEIKAHIKSEAKRLGRTDLIPDTWKAAEADLVKGDGATHDSAELRDILVGLINCMKAELDELASGEQELGDIRQLLETVSMFCCWWQDEAWAGETTSPYEPQEDSVMLAAEPDTTKAADADAPAEDTEKVAAPDETKAAEPTTGAAVVAPQTPESSSSENLAELVKSAIAVALKPVAEAAEEREKALTAELATVKADLAKALALPEPGGPVITRTADQTAAARQSDALRLKTEADELLRKADVTASYDQYMADGYRERAKQLLKQAAI